MNSKAATSAGAAISRRTFLAQAALVPTVFAADKPTRIVDTHTHFYDPSRPGGVPWPRPEERLIHRTVLPREYREMAAPLGVRGTVVVEASAWLEDNQWLLDLAKDEPFLLGIVGNLDPLDSAFGANLRRFAANQKFRGIRIGGKLLTERGREPAFLDAMKALAAADLSLDLNGRHDYLAHIPALAEAVPGLRIMVDHCGSPGRPGQLAEGWADAIRALAKWPGVFCKVSGLPEQAGTAEGKAPTAAAHYAPVLDVLWETFGADRLVFGSNWPVSEKGAPFRAVLELAQPWFAAKGPGVVEKVHEANALRFYRWPER